MEVSRIYAMEAHALQKRKKLPAQKGWECYRGYLLKTSHLFMKSVGMICSDHNN
jgi:hypothetical protein